jgi:transcription factor 1
MPMGIHTEQLIAQLFRSIPDGQWLFQYGRVPMSFILSDYIWQVSTLVVVWGDAIKRP